MYEQPAPPPPNAEKIIKTLLLEEDEEVDTVDPLLLCRADCPSEVETVYFNRNYKRFINMDKRLRHHAKKVKQSVLKRSEGLMQRC